MDDGHDVGGGVVHRHMPPIWLAVCTKIFLRQLLMRLNGYYNEKGQAA